ncbi:MAG: LysM peptidoglycan-binding domain-containing protein [Anaeroplasmataceae bacterium]|nr:LysM peptidoglycan-binding domain-containing protein [Anaeroplasmataceae bacterium]
MLEHIVKNGETIEEILNMYHIELNELKNSNLHLTDFSNLASGMKIRIPLITAEVEQILDNTESFVQRYYPKMVDFEEEPKVEPVEEPKVLIEEKPKVEEPQLTRRAYPGILPPKNPYKRF